MANELLATLAKDTEALLLGGVTELGVLQGRQASVKQLGQQVPALARLAEQVDRVLAAPPGASGKELLGLGVIMARVGAAQVRPATAGGELAAPVACEKLTSPADNYDLEPLYYGVTRGTRGTTNIQFGDAKLRNLIRDAAKRGTVRDLRLIGLWINKMNDYHVGKVVVENVMPALGEAVVPHLLARFNPRGENADAELLRRVAELRGKPVLDLLHRSLDSGSMPVRVAALDLMASLDRPAAEARALALLPQETDAQVGAVAVQVLAGSKKKGMIEALLAIVGDDIMKFGTAGALQHSRHPAITQRLLALLAPECLDKQASIVLSIVAALGGRKDPLARPRLMEIWGSATAPSIRYQAGQALLKLGEPADLDAVASAAADPDASLRQLVVEAMLLQDPAASFTHFAAVSDPMVRFQVINLFISRHRYASKELLDLQWLDAGLALATDESLWQQGQPLINQLAQLWSPLLNEVFRLVEASVFDRLAPIFEPLYLARPERVYIVNSALQRVQQQPRLDPRWVDRLAALLEDAALWQATALPSLREATALALVAALERGKDRMDLARVLNLWAVLRKTRIWAPRVACLLLQRYCPELELPKEPDYQVALPALILALAARDRPASQAFAASLLGTPWPEVRQAAIDALAIGADDQALAAVSGVLAGAEEESVRSAALQVLQKMAHPAVAVGLLDWLTPDRLTGLIRADEGARFPLLARVADLLVARGKEARDDSRLLTVLATIWQTHPDQAVRLTAGVALLASDPPGAGEALVRDLDYRRSDFTNNYLQQIVILALRRMEPAQAYEQAGPLFATDRVGVTNGLILAAVILTAMLPKRPVDPRNDPNYGDPDAGSLQIYVAGGYHKFPSPDHPADPRWRDRAVMLLGAESAWRDLLAGSGLKFWWLLRHLAECLSMFSDRRATPSILRLLDALLDPVDAVYQRTLLHLLLILQDPAAIPQIQAWRDQGRLAVDAVGDWNQTVRTLENLARHASS